VHWSVNLRWKGLSDNVVESVKKRRDDIKFLMKRGDEVAESDEQTVVDSKAVVQVPICSFNVLHRKTSIISMD
jgi:hypothetical protein